MLCDLVLYANYINCKIIYLYSNSLYNNFRAKKIYNIITMIGKKIVSFSSNSYRYENINLSNILMLQYVQNVLIIIYPISLNNRRKVNVII